MRILLVSAAIVAAAAVVVMDDGGAPASAEPAPSDLGAAAAGCPATEMEWTRPPGERAGWMIEQDRIWVAGYGSGPDGSGVSAVALPRKRDGLMQQKFPWWRRADDRRSQGKLRIRGRRLPEGSSLRVRQTPGYTVPRARFVASALIFSAPGCWHVSAKSGKARLRFVIWVIDSGNPPPGVVVD